MRRLPHPLYYGVGGKAAFCCAALLALFMSCASATGAEETPDFKAAALGLFQAADRVGDLRGDPPAASVFSNDQLVGYAFLTDRVLAIPAYSGKPITALVGLDLKGVIRGVKVLRHEEPILVVGVRPEDLEGFVAQYEGYSIRDRVKIGGLEQAGKVTFDGLTGATITAMVLNASVMRSLRIVARARGLLPQEGTEPGGSGAEPSDEPPWKSVWRDRRPETAVLIAGLTALTLILLFQDWLARRPKLLHRLRYGFLAFTVIYIGWYSLAQLSVVNVLTFAHAVVHDFRWDTFLIDPIVFILWGFVAVTLLLWGRSVFCGWLCPYGALQEFAQQIGMRLRLPQLEFPQVVHERLWALKYIIFLVLFALSLQSLGTALPYAEVEPFKTAFTLRFDRAWPYVVYAGAFVLISAFNRKFFCKYLCPLGAALAIPARLKLFDWLRRRNECGRPCQVCANECEVRAIRPTGEINPLECQYCLDCQVTYWDTQKCPPLVQRRRRRQVSQGCEACSAAMSAERN